MATEKKFPDEFEEEGLRLNQFRHIAQNTEEFFVIRKDFSPLVHLVTEK